MKTQYKTTKQLKDAITAKNANFFKTGPMMGVYAFNKIGLDGLFLECANVFNDNTTYIATLKQFDGNTINIIDRLERSTIISPFEAIEYFTQ